MWLKVIEFWRHHFSDTFSETEERKKWRCRLSITNGCQFFFLSRHVERMPMDDMAEEENVMEQHNKRKRVAETRKRVLLERKRWWFKEGGVGEGLCQGEMGNKWKNFPSDESGKKTTQYVWCCDLWREEEVLLKRRYEEALLLSSDLMHLRIKKLLV